MLEQNIYIYINQIPNLHIYIYVQMYLAGMAKLFLINDDLSNVSY